MSRSLEFGVVMHLLKSKIHKLIKKIYKIWKSFPQGGYLFTSLSTWRGNGALATWSLAGGVAGVSVPGINSELGGVGWGKSFGAPQALEWIWKV